MAAKPVFFDTSSLYCDWTLTSQQQEEVNWQIARRRDVREMVKQQKKQRLKRLKEKFLKKKYSNKNLRNVKNKFKKKLNFDIIKSQSQGDQGEGSQSQGDQGEGLQSQGDQGEGSKSQGDQGEGDLRRSKPVSLVFPVSPVSPVSLSPVSESPINLNVTMFPQSSPTFNIPRQPYICRLLQYQKTTVQHSTVPPLTLFVVSRFFT